MPNEKKNIETPPTLGKNIEKYPTIGKKSWAPYKESDYKNTSFLHYPGWR